MPEMTLILNPSSNRGDTRKKKFDLETEVQRQAEADPDDFQLTWQVTESRRHATELARQAADAGADIVVAVGGDGTVHEVVNGLLQVDADKRPTLGIIPVGSGNDFAFNLGLPHDPAEAITHLFSKKTRPIDAGILSDPSGRSEYFDNTLGFGFSGVVNHIASGNQILRGFILYFVAVIQSILFHPQDLKVAFTIDGDEVLERRVSMLSVNNGPREGGGFPTAPQALMDDGKLSYVILRNVNRIQMFYFIPVVMNTNQHKYPNFFEPGDGETIHITSDEPMYIHMDGEQYSLPEDKVTDVTARILPAALTVLCDC